MKTLLVFFLGLTISWQIMGQNVGIGTTTPTLGKFQVSGVAGAGATTAAFGTDGSGISLQRSWPTIGFNQYRDAITPGSQGKYMSTGCGSIMYFDPIGGSIGWDMFPSGTAHNFTTTGTRTLTILNNGNIGILGNADALTGLIVNRIAANTSGTAMFKGSNHHSYFNLGSNEETYIRPGKASSKVLINDITGGMNMLYGKNAIGTYPSNTYNPILAAEFYGAISLSNSYTINVQTSQWISNPSLSSYVKVQNTSTNSAIVLDIANGNIDGQILVIEGNLNPFTINRSDPPFDTNVYGSSDLIIGGGDVLTLIWNANRVQWMPLSFQNN